MRVHVASHPGLSTRYIAKRMQRGFEACGCLHVDDVPAPVDLWFVYYANRQRKALPRPAALWLVDEPYHGGETVEWSRPFDYAFLNDRATIEAHRASRPHWLPACYEPIDVPDPIPCDVALVGAGFPNRRRLLAPLMRAGLDVRLVGPDWPPAWHPRAEWVTPEEAARYYAGAAINLNLHREARGEQATALNFRAFEIASVGGFQITEDRPDRALMLPSAAKYDGTPRGLLDAVRHWLDRPDDRALRAAAARREAFPHTFTSRARTVLQHCGLWPVEVPYTALYEGVRREHRHYGINHGAGALDIVLEAVRGLPRPRVVDVGAGENGFLRAVKRQRPEARTVGTDIAPRPGTGVIEAPAWDLRCVQGPVNALTAFDVLEHLTEPDLDRTLETWAWHRPGIVVVSVSSRPADTILADGRNAHLTVRPRWWWEARLSRAFGQCEDRDGYLVCQAKGG